MFLGWSVATLDAIEEIRLRWLRERSVYDEFCSALVKSTEQALKVRGVAARVTSRVKEVDSLVRKLMKQAKEGRSPTYEGIVDKVGVRVVVRFKEEVDEIADLFKVIFNCAKFEMKSEGQQVNEFGYRSCHMDIALRPDHDGYSSFKLFVGELQIRTLAQDLWAEMAHELSYKSVLRELAPSLQHVLDRRVYILSALVESADMEFSRINREVLGAPGAERLLLLRVLEHEYFKFTSVPYDPEFSFESIGLLAQVNPTPLHLLREDLAKFTENNRAKLAHIFSDQQSNQDRSAFIFQPEVILIFECLDNRPIALEEAWEARFTMRELDRLASAWAKPTF